MLAMVSPEVVVEVAQLTVKAVLLSGPSVAKIAGSAKSSPNRRTFEAIMNCSAPLCPMTFNIRGDDVSWECIGLPE